MQNDDKQFLLSQLKWIGFYAVIGFMISLVIPFPISLAVAIVIFILINFVRTRIVLKRSGIDMNTWFRSFSSPSSSYSMSGYMPLKYYCMSCGKEHKEIACPSCSSKMKRVE